MQTTLKLSNTLKSNKELTYRVLAQIASSVPAKVKFDQVEYNGGTLITIQGIAASYQDILKFIYPDKKINISPKSKDWVKKIETAYTTGGGLRPPPTPLLSNSNKK